MYRRIFLVVVIALFAGNVLAQEKPVPVEEPQEQKTEIKTPEKPPVKPSVKKTPLSSDDAAAQSSDDADTNPSGNSNSGGGAGGGIDNPSGGLVIPGLPGALFDIEPSTGTATMGIPIEVPPGRGGIQPAVSLMYSSNAKSGIAGIGWNMEMGFISRSTKKGVPRYDTTDSFTMNQGGGSEELINTVGNLYSPKLESGAFLKIEKNANTWTITDKKGTQYKFGHDAQSRQFPVGDQGRTFRWYLDEVVDINGNRMTVEYLRDNEQLYPQRIKYNFEVSPPGNYGSEVEIVTEVRPDTMESYLSGFQVVTAQRIKEIKVRAVGALQRRYEMVYAQSASTQRSLLTRVRQYGSDNTSTTPDVIFNYHDNGPKGFTHSAAWTIPPQMQFTSWMNGHDVDLGVRLVDLNSDNYPDLTRSYRGCTGLFSEVYLNNKMNGWNVNNTWVPQGVYNVDICPLDVSQDTGVRYSDVNSDGRVDISEYFQVEQGGVSQNTYVRLGNNWVRDNNWNMPPFPPSSNTPQGQGGQAVPYVVKYTNGQHDFQGTVMADVTGDGRVDYVRSKEGYGQSHFSFVNSGTGGWQYNSSWNTPTGTGTDFADGAVLTDLNADGLMDIFYSDGTTVVVHINNGSNWTVLPTSSPWHQLGGIALDINTQNGSAQLADINGDGLEDIIVAKGNLSSGSRVLINTGHNFVRDDAWVFPEGRFANGGTRLADVNADGLVDYMVYDYNNLSPKVYLNQGVVPVDILKRIDNGVGGQTTIEYGSSAHGASLFVPFVIPIVTSVTASDSFSGNSYITRYEYREGLWNATEREFRGFGEVKVIDPDNNYTISQFYTDDNVRKGRLLNQKVFTSAGVAGPYTWTINTWTPQVLGNGVTFVYLSRSSNSLYANDTPIRRTVKDFFYEEPVQLGNLTKVFDWGEINPDTWVDIGTDARTVETQYLNNTSGTNRLIGLPKESVAKDYQNVQTRQSWFWYDNNPNLNDLPTRGLLTKKEDWNNNSQGHVNNPVTQYSYNAWGNLMSTTDARGKVTTVTYDPTYNLFPLTTTNAMNQVVSSEYYGVNGVALDDGNGLKGLWGQLKSTTDPNNQTGRKTYDAFGRGVKDISPLDTVALPTGEGSYEYLSNSSGSQGIALDGNSSAQANDVTSYTHSHAVGNTTNRMLVVSIALRDNTASPLPQTNSVTYANQAMTLINRERRNASGDYIVSEMWYLVNPPTGTNNVVAAFNSSMDGAAIGVTSLSGVAQTAPEANNKSSSSASGSALLITALSPNAWVIDHLVTRNSTMTRIPTGPSQTIIYQRTNAGQLTSNSSRRVMTTPSPTWMLWQFNAISDWVDVGASFAPAPVQSGFGSKVIKKQRVESGQAATIEVVEFYDGLGRLIQKKTPTENSGVFVVSGQTQYNSRGLPEYQYLPFFSNSPRDTIDPVVVTRPRARAIYDGFGRVIESRNSDNTFSTVRYGDWMTETIDENGHMQRSYSDANGRLIKKEEYLGANGRGAPTYPATSGAVDQYYTLYATTEYTYDSAGNLTQTKDAHNNITTIQYDKLGRKTQMTDLDMGTWSYQYDLNGNLVGQIDAKNQQINFTYDDLNRLVNKIGGGGLNVNYTYDDVNVQYSKGRLTKADYQVNATLTNDTRFHYDRVGREEQSIKMIDTTAYDVRRRYDAMNRLKDVQYPDTKKTFYTYNGGGQIETVNFGTSNVPSSGIALDANSSAQANNVTSYTHSHAVGNTQNRMLIVSIALRDNTATPLPQTNSVTYANQAMTLINRERRNAGGDYIVSEMWYLVNPPTGTNNVVASFNSSMNGAAIGVTSLSGVAQSAPEANNKSNSSASGSVLAITTLTPNAWVIDHLVTRNSTITRTPTGPSQTIIYQQANAGQLASNSSRRVMTTPSTTWMLWQFNAISDWVDVGASFAPAPAQSGPNPIVLDVDYNAHGQITHIEYGNGVATDYTYHPQNLRLQRILTHKVNPVTVIQDLNYTYDNVGDILTIIDNVHTADQSFQYDALNRLVQAVGQTYGTKTYQYDEIGNILQKDGLNYIYGANNAGPHAVTSLLNGATVMESFAYDANGNMVSRSAAGIVTDYIYDVENRLKQVKKRGVVIAEYEYDGDGGRVKRTDFRAVNSGWYSCFLPGTKVLMADGSAKNIEAIKIGDSVLSYDETKMENVVSKVTEAMEEEASEYLVINIESSEAGRNPAGSHAGIQIKVTAEHPFYSEGKWVEAGKLAVGQKLLTNDGKEIEVKKVEKVSLEKPIAVYNVAVDLSHNYYVQLSAISHQPSAKAFAESRGLKADDFILVHNKISYAALYPSGQAIVTKYVGSLYEEDNNSGRQTNFIFLGGTRVAAVTTVGTTITTLWYQDDHLGGTNVITDSTGAKKEVIEYSPFGEFSRRDRYGSSAETAWYYFTGKPYDDETGLIFFGARYYDPRLARFITADTVVQDPYDPQTLNRYSYCSNNPVNLIDLDGHSWWKKFWKKASGFVATVVGVALGFINPFLGMLAYSLIAASGQSGNFGANFGINFASSLVGWGIGAGVSATWGSSYLSGLAASALGGAGAGAVTSAMLGGNVGLGALAGLAGGTIGYVGGGIWPLGADAVAGGVGSVIQGGKFGDGASQGALHSLGNAVGGLMAPMETLGQQDRQAGDAVYLKPDGPASILVSLFEGGVFGHTGVMVSDTEMVQSSWGHGGVKKVSIKEYENRGAYVSRRFRGNQQVIKAANALTTQKISYGFFPGQKVCSTCNAAAFSQGGYGGWYGIGPNTQASGMGYSQFHTTMVYGR